MGVQVAACEHALQVLGLCKLIDRIIAIFAIFILLLAILFFL